METNIEEVNKGVFRLSGTGKEIQMTLADIQNLSISANKYDFDNDDMLIHNFRGKCISYYSLVFDFYWKKYEYSVFNERGRYVGDKKKYIHNPGFSKLLYFLDFNNYFVSTRNQY